MTHVIQDLEVALTIVDGPRAMEMQHGFNRLFQRKVLPLLEQILDQYSPSHVQHRLDEVTVDLGDLDWDSLSNQGWQAVQEKLTQQLFAALKRAHRTKASESNVASESLVSDLRRNEFTPNQSTNTLNPWQVFQFFVEKGYLAGRVAAWDTSEKVIAGLSRINRPSLRQSIQEFLKDPNQQYRLLTQLNASQRLTLAKHLVEERQETNLTSIIQSWFSLIPVLIDPKSLKSLEYESWVVIFNYLAKQKQPTFQSETLVQALVKVIASDAYSIKAPPEQYHPLLAPHKSWKKYLLPVLEQKADAIATTAKPLFPKPNKPKSAVLEEEVFVSNAGLVLLWRYLRHFFENLGLLQDRAFKDELAQHRAVYFLGYLATGRMGKSRIRITAE